MKKLIPLLLLLTVFSVNAQNLNNLITEKPTTNVFAEYSMLEVEFFKNGDADKFKNKNISSYIIGFNSTIPMSKTLDLTGTIGLSEGFSYNFITGNLAINLSENFALTAGSGVYFINDDRWVTVGLDGNEPSNLEFGMNFGLNLMLNTSLGLTMKYNIIEEKQDDVNSLSLNGLSFGIILK